MAGGDSVAVPALRPARAAGAALEHNQVTSDDGVAAAVDAAAVLVADEP